MARSDPEKAAMYAAFKMLERELEKDGDLPAGFCIDVGGQKVEIELPNGTVVERATGTNGDGSMWKASTTSLYGWHVFTLLAKRLKAFNQWHAIRAALIEVLRQSLAGKKRVAEGLEEVDPELAAEVATIKREFAPPPRREDTPRICKDRGVPATITVKPKMPAWVSRFRKGND
jgi:hypothetical protein